MTVLFADVVRSMDIAAALDLERLREIMTDAYGRHMRAAARSANRDVGVDRP